MIYDCLRFLSESWENRPVVVALSVIALAVLLYVLLDTHFHRRKFKKRRQDKNGHHR